VINALVAKKINDDMHYMEDICGIFFCGMYRFISSLRKWRQLKTGKLLDSLARKDAVAALCSGKFNVAYCSYQEGKLPTSPTQFLCVFFPLNIWYKYFCLILVKAIKWFSCIFKTYKKQINTLFPLPSCKKKP
jgi:hypothetical protein